MPRRPKYLTRGPLVPYLIVEPPDTEATVDFLSENCTVKVSITRKPDGTRELYVYATAGEYADILIEKTADLPEQPQTRPPESEDDDDETVE
jgi:hypothetical protein